MLGPKHAYMYTWDKITPNITMGKGDGDVRACVSSATKSSQQRYPCELSLWYKCELTRPRDELWRYCNSRQQ